MTSPMPSRQYDLVHLGPTGYTGQYTVLRICGMFPSDMTWAIAGRSQHKLEAVVEDLRKKFPDRKPPAIEICQQRDADMDELAAKTRVIITTVGPYTRFGEPVVKACAKHGTGYVDATGEVPWVKVMIDKYHEQAKESGAIIVPQCAIESAVPDLLVYAMAEYAREKLALPLGNVTNLMWENKTALSGGTYETVFSVAELFPLGQLLGAYKPYALSPIGSPKGTPSARRNWGRVSGTAKVPKLGLGVNTGAIQGDANAAIVCRTWGLFEEADRKSARTEETVDSSETKNLSYGSNFHYLEGMRVGGHVRGFLIHLALTSTPPLLIIPPIRWLLRRFVFKPGQGPTAESAEKDRLEIKAVAEPDGASAKRYVLGRVQWQGSTYDLSGLYLASAAKTILELYKGESGEAKAGLRECYAKHVGGGVLTPACLGESFLENVRNSGYKLEVWEES